MEPGSKALPSHMYGNPERIVLAEETRLSAWITDAHNEYLAHLMAKKNCCAAMHGRWCRVGQRLKRQYLGRYWADYVMQGDGRAARQQRLLSVPSDHKRRVMRLAIVLHRRRGGHE